MAETQAVHPGIGTEIRPELRTDRRILVGIPAYNEAAGIADVVRNAHEYADSVLVVDDGSTDTTATCAEAAGATVVRHPRNRGYGGALCTIFEEAADRDYEWLVTLDADGQHEPSDIPQLISHHRETDADVVIGSRFVDGGFADAPLYRRVGLRVVNALANLSLGLAGGDSRVHDTQSGFRAYGRHAIESLADDRLIGAGMGASTDVLYHASHNGYAIEEVPTTVYYDVEDASTHNPVAHGFDLVRNLLQTIESDRPLSALAIPGFVLVIGALILGLWVVSNLVNTGTFPFGVAVFSGVVGTAGTFVGLTGIVLHALNLYERRA